MLMDPNERAVDKDIFEIRIVAERLENPLPDALLHPAPEARIDGEPLAEPFRQIAMWSTLSGSLEGPAATNCPGRTYPH